MKQLIMLILIITLISLPLTSCESITSANGVAILNITMTDFKFDPLAWTVSAGQGVTLNLTNSGTVAHTWTLMQTPISGTYTDSDIADILFDSGAVPADSPKEVSFTAPRKPGVYQVICIEPGHFEDGMIGLLTVK